MEIDDTTAQDLKWYLVSQKNHLKLRYAHCKFPELKKYIRQDWAECRKLLKTLFPVI